MSTIDMPSAGPRLVREGADGTGRVVFSGVVIEASHLAPYIGEKVHVHDGYSEYWQICEYLDAPRRIPGRIRSTRSGAEILSIVADGNRWKVSPPGGSVSMDGRRFVSRGRAADIEFGVFEDVLRDP